MKKAVEKGGATVRIGPKVETGNKKTQEGMADVLKDIGIHCDEVSSGDKKCTGNATFLSTTKEAKELKAACDKCDADGGLRQLHMFRGEPNPSVFIARLKAVMSAEDNPSPANLPTAQGGNDAIKAHGDGNQGAAHTGALGVAEPTAIPGVEYMELSSIEIDPEASSMFERSPAVSDALRQSMKKVGFMFYHPVKTCGRDDGSCTPYDGHTRLEIAAELGITEIPVVKTRFATRKEFLDAAINEQIDRRNLSIRDKFSIVKHYAPVEAENARLRHGKNQSADKSADSQSGRANAIIGKKIGCGPDTVARMRFLIEADNEELLKKVYSDVMSISEAYTMLKPKKVKQINSDVGTSVGSTGNKPDIKPPQSAKTDKQANTGLDAKANGVQEAIADENSEMATPAYGARIDTVEPDDQNIAKQNEDIPADVKAPVADPACSLQRCGGAPKEPETQSDDISAGTKRLLVAIASNVIETAKAGIRELLADCDPGIAAVVSQCLEDNTETGHHRVQSKKNPAEELTFSKGNSNQQQRKENVKADTLTGKHK